LTKSLDVSLLDQNKDVEIFQSLPDIQNYFHNLKKCLNMVMSVSTAWRMQFSVDPEDFVRITVKQVGSLITVQMARGSVRTVIST
jgi:hypothetical protein